MPWGLEQFEPTGSGFECLVLSLRCLKAVEPLGDGPGGHKLTVGRSFLVTQASGSTLDSLPLVHAIPSLIQWMEMKVLNHNSPLLNLDILSQRWETQRSNSGVWLFLDFHSFEFMLLHFLIEKL